VSTATSLDCINEFVTARSAVERAFYIKKQAETGPVIVFCSGEFSQALQSMGVPFMKVTPETYDGELFQHLHIKAQGDINFRVLVCEGLFGMRGIDYRSDIPIILII
jgi:hypothetical protein